MTSKTPSPDGAVAPPATTAGRTVPRLSDAIDAEIVRVLSRDARSTLGQISEQVGLSSSAVQSRLRRLESVGIIDGYRVVVDAEAVGRPLSAFVEISPLDPGQPDDAPEKLQGIPSIEACHSIAGEANYLLFVRVASPRDLEALVNEIRQTAQVSTRTTVVLQTYFEGRPVSPVL